MVFSAFAMNEHEASPKLSRTLTRFDATMIVMGTIIGVGIFFNPQKTAAETGSGGFSLLAWALGSVLALTGAFTYAALGKILPQTGGPYIYLREAFGKLAAFLYGWMVLTAIGSGAIAVVCLICVDYFGRLIDESFDGTTRAALACGMILTLTFANVVGVKVGSTLLNVFTILKIAALLILVGAGLVYGTREISFDVVPDLEPSTMLAGVPAAMTGVLFSFGGWQNLSNVAGEMKSAEKDFVPAVIRGVIGVAVIYLLANVGFLRLLSVQDLVAARTPVADAFQIAFGAGAASLASAAILISACGIVNGLLLSLPRIYFAMAQDGVMPRSFATVSPRFSTPVVAIVAQGLIGAGFCFFRSVGALTDYVAVADWMFFSLNAIALFALVRVRKLDVGLGYPIVPGIFTVLAIAVTFGMIVTQWEQAKYGLCLLAAGFVVYFASASSRRAAAT